MSPRPGARVGTVEKLLWLALMGLSQDAPRMVSHCLVRLCIAFSLSAEVSLASEVILDRGAHSTSFDTNGALISWPGVLEGSPEFQSAGEIRYKGQTLLLHAPTITCSQDRISFRYHWASEPALELIIQHQIQNGKSARWVRRLELRGPARLESDLSISIQSCPAPLPDATWLPLLNGTGSTLGTNTAAGSSFAAGLPGKATLLAPPMLSIPFPGSSTSDSALMMGADPFFSTRFTRTQLEWTYLAKAGLEHGRETRTIVIGCHKGPIEQSLDCFFRNLLPGSTPGPAWLHDIALVDFDYLSDEGRGWFHDIDELTTALPKSDRRKVFFCLHGWYDFLGRYCFDNATGKFDREWVAFSNYEQARDAHPSGNIGGQRVPMGFENCKPHKMSLNEVHRRLQYARARGLRVGLYFADGLNAGDALPGFEPEKVLYWGGWHGPDTKGKSYIQNPLNPEVRSFFLNYTKALLAEFGSDLDALVWDETFHIPCGQLGTETWPGYADRAMMRLTQEITGMVDNYNRRHHRQIAFLTSDCLGAVIGDALKGPYALVSHGTYQDSWCQPKAWSYGIFANYRNVLWSCCWWPISKWSWVDFGVRNYQVPVSISNGWGDDTGFAEMTPAQRARVLSLFNWRNHQRTRLHWFAESSLPVFSGN